MPKKHDYPKGLDEYLSLKLESFSNNAKIARMAVREFGLDKDLHESIRKKVAALREKLIRDGKRFIPKRLFFDIETTYVKAIVWRPGKQYVNPSNIEGVTKIICICYKWQNEEKVHTLKWDGENDDELVKKFIKVLGQADEIVAHNGDRFDLKHLRTRAVLTGNLMFPTYRTLDTLKKARKYFNFHSNRLDYLGDVLEVGRKLDHEGMGLWKRVQEGETKKIRNEALKEMCDYCVQDVILLQDVFEVLNPFIDHNTNFAVIKDGLRGKWKCPECTSENVELSHTDTTPMGYVKRHMKCNDCKKFYHVSNRTYTQFITKDLYSE